MADKQISDLTAATAVQTADLFVLEQSGVAKKLTGQILINYLTSIADGHGGIASITWTTSGTSGNGQYHYATIHYADTTTSTFTIRDGVKGNPGDSWYVHIKYASAMPTSDADMGSNPDKWIGIYSGTSSTAPAHYTSYTWYQWKGDKGDTGDTGASIDTVTKTGGDSSPGSTDTYTVTLDTGVVAGTFSVYNGLNGNGSVSSVNGVFPDAGGDVALSANDIQTSGSVTVEAALDDKQSKIQAVGLLKGAGSGSVSSATKGIDYAAYSLTLTLTAAGWSSNQQTVQESALFATGYSYIVAPASASFTAYGESQIYADNVTTNGQMTFHCVSVPSSDLTVNVIRVVS